MKKILSLVLALVICLSLCACGKSDGCSCDCAQCADCEKKTQSAEIADASHTNDVPEAAEQNDNVIEFETPIVVAEDEYLRIEVTRFYQEYRSWKGSSPNIADSATEGASLEKFLVFKYCNKSSQPVIVQMDDMYLGNDGASYYSVSSPSVEIAEGKNNFGTFLVRTGEKETLKSMEELYSLDGQFYVWSKDADGALRNQHNLKFSIPNSMPTSSSAAPVAENPDAWNQFRDYLKARGPVTVVTNNEYGQTQITIEENAGTIQISRMGEGTINSGKVYFYGLYSTRFELPANAKTVHVQEGFLEEGTDEHGNRREKSGKPSHTWDIQNYHRGDEVSFPMDYTDLDPNGNYIQKTGTLTVTDAYANIADTLSQTLAESGLGITMADIGFINY